jgi:hypothetical protein
MPDKEIDNKTFNPNDAVFEKQALYLSTIPNCDFQLLSQLYTELKSNGYDDKFMYSKTFSDLHALMYKMELIFGFDWMQWETGKVNIQNSNFDFTQCTLLELSMYLTSIFRADRFFEGTIECNFINGKLDKIFNALINLTASH